MKKLKENTFLLIGIFLHLVTAAVVFTSYPESWIDFVLVWIFGAIFSAVELGSRYKDDPWFVITSGPGMCYMITNSLICCFGLFIIITFGLNFEVDDSLPDIAQRTTDILTASLGSFFIMRSSFLKLGNEQSQLDLGLNLVLKKLLEMIDRQVDRVRADRRAKDIADILKNVTFDDVISKIKSFSMHVMQNVPQEDINKMFAELTALKNSDDCEEIKKLSAGLHIYNIVGKSVLESVVSNLELDNSDEPQSEGVNQDTDNGKNKKSVKSEKNNQKIESRTFKSSIRESLKPQSGGEQEVNADNNFEDKPEGDKKE